MMLLKVIQARFSLTATPNGFDGDLDITLSVGHTGANYIRGTAPTMITLPSGETEVILEVPTIQDSTDMMGAIDVTVQSGTGYTVSGTASTVTMNVVDAGIQVGFEGVQNGREGGNIPMKVIRATASQNPLDVYLHFSDGVYSTFPDGVKDKAIGSVFGNSLPPMKVTIPAGSNEVMVPIPTTDDDVNYLDNYRVVYGFSNKTGREYEFDSTILQREVTVLENDPKPTVSINSTSNSIIEGDIARFQINSVTKNYLDMDVNLEVRDIGNFVAETIPTTITIPALATSANLEIPTASNDIIGNQGSITVQILSGTFVPGTNNLTAYNVAASPNNSATVQVMESGPVISVSSVDSVEEGDLISLTLSASSPPTAPLIIPVSISDGVNSTFAENEIFGRGDVLGQNVPTGISFDIGASSTTLQIPTASDEADEGDIAGLVYIKLDRTPGANYNLGQNPPIHVLVEDNDDPPLISISALQPKAFKGRAAQFKIMSSKTIGKNTNISVSVSEARNYLDYSQIPTMIEFDSGKTEIILDVPVNQSVTDSTEGTIAVTLQAGSNYSVATSPNNSAIVTVTSVVETVTLNDSGETNNITEGMPVQFTVSRAASAQTQVAVNVQVTNNIQDFIAVEPPTVILIEPNSLIGTYSLATVDDNVIDQNASFSITIMSGLGYTISGGTTSNVMVQDNDTTITFSPQRGEITEGESVQLSFTSSVTLAFDVEIEISINENGNFLPDNFDQAVNPIIPANRDRITYSIPTENDEIGDPESTLEVVVEDGVSYVAPAENTATFVVEDDDGGAPLITISTTTPSVIEGDPARFKLTATPAPPRKIIVNIQVTSEGNFIAWRSPRTIIVNQMEANFRIITREYYENDSRGSIQVQILDGLGYVTNSGDNSETVQVTNRVRENIGNLPRISVASNVANAILTFLPTRPPATELGQAKHEPIISISANQPEILEGSRAEFQFTSSHSLDSDLKVNVNVFISENYKSSESPSFIVITEGQSKATLEIPTENDNHAEENGSVAIKIESGRGYRTNLQNRAQVIISDHEDRQLRANQIETGNQEVLSIISTSLNTRAMNALNFRLQQDFNSSDVYTFELNGGSTIQDFLKTSGNLVNDDSTSWRPVLGSSKFTVNLNSASESILPTTIWGIGDNQEFINESQSSEQGTNGNILTGNFGIDTQINDYLITGLATSISESELEFDRYNDFLLGYHTQTSTLNPYIIWRSPNHAFQFQSIAGWGSSKIEIQQENYQALNLESDIMSIGLKGSNDLLSSIWSKHQNSELNLNSSIGYVRQFIYGHENIIDNMKIDTGYYQFVGEGSQTFDFQGGSLLQPEFSIGLLGDYTNQQHEFGTAISGGINYQNNFGIEISHFGNIYIPYGEIDNEWGVTNSVDFDYANDQIGLLIHLAPAWGQTNSNDSIPNWQEVENSYGFAERKVVNGFELDSEVGYGITLNDQDGILTPFVKTELSNDVQRHRIGNQIYFGSDVKLELYGEQTVKSNANSEYQLQVKGNIRW